MKKILLAIALTAFLCQADEFAYVDFSFVGKDYSTNFIATITSGDDFVFAGPLSSGCNIKSFNVYRFPQQFKNRCVLLAVGISEYSSDSKIAPLPCCKTDAEHVGSQLAPYYEQVYLFNEEATKGNIRTVISKYASELKPGDTFIYYHSGQSKNNVIAAYDNFYSEDSLMSDLGEFQKGVHIAVIRDLNFSGAANIQDKSGEVVFDNLSDILFITADKQITKKKYKYPLSPFTEALLSSIEPLTDQDGDFILSFNEIFQRAEAYYKKSHPDGTCTLENDILGATLVFAVIDEGSTDGLLVQEDDRFGLAVKNVSGDVIVSVSDDTYPEKIEIKKGSYKLSIKDKNGETTYSEKFNLTFNIPAKGITNFPEDRIGLYLNSKAFSAWYNQKSAKNGFTTAIFDYWFDQIGKIQVKRKNDFWVCRYTFKTKNRKIFTNIFSSDGESQDLNLQYRNYFNLFQGSASFHKVYKTGKSLTAKLAK